MKAKYLIDQKLVITGIITDTDKSQDYLFSGNLDLYQPYWLKTNLKTIEQPLNPKAELRFCLFLFNYRVEAGC